MLDGKFMPAPDELVECNDGVVMPVMFFYAVEGADFTDIASACGFEATYRDVDSDIEEDELKAWWEAYQADEAKVLTEWQPTPPDGFGFGGKWHTEEGIQACFLRKLEGK